MDKKIAIILVNYKDYAVEFIQECRDSLRVQDYPMEQVRVYVVDNASSDETMAYLKNNFPEAVIIPRPDGNYSAGNNAGIKGGMEDGCDYFVIVNMDVKLDKNWLKELVEGLEANPDAGIVQSKILMYPRKGEEQSKPKINTLGNIAHFLGFGYTSHYLEDDREIEGYPEIGCYASGCSLITKREVIEKIGGYNEEYYMYHDDFEFSGKARLAGYKIYLAPKSVMYHKYEFSRSVRMAYYMERNRWFAILAFYKLPSIIIIFPALLFMELGLQFFALLNGMYKTKIETYKYFFKAHSWKKIKAERKHIRSIRRIKDREFLKNFSGVIKFQEIDNPALKYVANPIFSLYWTVAKNLIWW